MGLFQLFFFKKKPKSKLSGEQAAAVMKIFQDRKNIEEQQKKINRLCDKLRERVQTEENNSPETGEIRDTISKEKVRLKTMVKEYKIYKTQVLQILDKK